MRLFVCSREDAMELIIVGGGPDLEDRNVLWFNLPIIFLRVFMDWKAAPVRGWER